MFKTLCSVLLLPILIISCTQQNEPKAELKNESVVPSEQPVVQAKKLNIHNFEANRVTEIDPSVLSILEDRHGNYWFGTNAGAFYYDGKNLLALTIKDGLFQNQVQDIQEDAAGNIWFSTSGFGVNRFDGEKMIPLKAKESSPLQNTVQTNWKIAPGDLWFCAGDGVFSYNQAAFNYLPFPKSDLNAQYASSSPYQLSPYGVYSTLKDRKGHLWFGTQAMGVCRYDGKTFAWLTEQGLQGPAVLAVFEDSKGQLWFGNNGQGLFLYDGTTLTNVTASKGLSNPAFTKTGKSGPKTLARVWSLNEDNSGNLWIGTGDAGAWRYDGEKLTQYTTKDGLPKSGIEVIYKDKKGELWFGTGGDGVYKLEGEKFVKFVF